MQGFGFGAPTTKDNKDEIKAGLDELTAGDTTQAHPVSQVEAIEDRHKLDKDLLGREISARKFGAILTRGEALRNNLTLIDSEIDRLNTMVQNGGKVEIFCNGQDIDKANGSNQIDINESYSIDIYVDGATFASINFDTIFFNLNGNSYYEEKEDFVKHGERCTINFSEKTFNADNIADDTITSGHHRDPAGSASVFGKEEFSLFLSKVIEKFNPAITHNFILENPRLEDRLIKE